MKSKEQLEKELFERKALGIIFDESDRLRGGDFEGYLKRLGKENLGKQIKEKVEAKQEMTKEIRQYNDYILTGGTKTFEEWNKMVEAK